MAILAGLTSPTLRDRILRPGKSDLAHVLKKCAEMLLRITIAQSADIDVANGTDTPAYTAISDTAAGLLANHTYSNASAYLLSAYTEDLSSADVATLNATIGFSTNGHRFASLSARKTPFRD